MQSSSSSIMSEMPRNSDGSSEQCKAGPDFFSFYACQIADLLSEDKNTLSNSNASELSQGKYVVVNDKESMDCSPKDVDSLFENSIGAELSDFKKGRLKGLLRQSVNDLSMEVEEMLDPVVSMSELRYKIRSNSLVTSPLDGDAAQVASKKPKLSSSLSPISITGNSHPIKSGSCKEVEDDLEFLLKNDNQLLVEETMKKYSDELSSTLVHMEQKLEETLDAIMSKCRYGFVPEELITFKYGLDMMLFCNGPMTRTEKRQLQKLIQQLPKENLVRVVEIIQRGRPAEKPCEEIFVDLEKEENVTLWRLYYYVEAVEKAKMLAQLQCSTTPTS
ncbi:Homeotic female sterile [Gossypium arboreum]|uniref:Homeotic female sterile n=1 Tax=Gossypium arboreum TaxID=29729 RepID=A0A0B0MBH3_GOSAR|nr:Homeotic female sterile [Gossypium arboreum]